MAIRINYNHSAQTAYLSLNRNNALMGKYLERLSTGLRINRAADDPVGLALSERFRSQSLAMTRASENAQDGISLLQTADGALNETASVLDRLLELSIEASNGTLTGSDRQIIHDEVVTLLEEINFISNSTAYNQKNLLNGESSAIVATNYPDLMAPIITGDIKSSGSYLLEINATSAGQLEVQQSGIMVTSIAASSTRVGQINDAITLEDGSFTAGNQIAENFSVSISGTISSNDNFTITATSTTTAEIHDSDSNLIGTVTAGGSSTLTGAGAGVTVFFNSGTIDYSAGVGESATFNTSTSSQITVDQDTRVASIASLNTAVGTTTTLTLYGNRTKSEITIYSSDSLEDVAGKISLAIYDPSRTSDLDMGGAIATGTSPDLVRIITTGADAGKIEITSPISGERGRINLVGETEVMTAFGFSTVQSATEPIFSVTATNLVTGATTTNTVGGTRASGIIAGITFDLAPYLDMQLQSDTGTANATGVRPYERPEMAIDSSDSIEVGLSVKVNQLDFHVGPARGQIHSIGIPEVSVAGLNLSNLNLTSVETAEEGITLVERAIQTASRVRSKIGAHENSLTRTVSYLDRAKIQADSSFDRIRGQDMAQGMIDYSRAQIMTDVAAAMLAQANGNSSSILKLLLDL